MQFTTNKIISIDESQEIVYLFDQYRQFYQCKLALQEAKNYLTQLLNNKASVIFAAYADNTRQQMVSFIQLYPLYSSVAMCKQWVLNDLYVLQEHRGQGVASLLLTTASQFAIKDKAERIILKTTKTNAVAKALYEKLDYILDTTFNHYALFLG